MSVMLIKNKCYYFFILPRIIEEIKKLEKINWKIFEEFKTFDKDSAKDNINPKM